jgi:uncharacterized protein YbjT (DUF2867 family)
MSNAPPASAELGFCLVTGGAGYLGRHLVEELLRRGQRVRAFDREPLELTHANLETLVGDVCDFGAVRKACQGIATVFHTAAVLDFRSYPRPRTRSPTPRTMRAARSKTSVARCATWDPPTAATSARSSSPYPSRPHRY